MPVKRGTLQLRLSVPRVSKILFYIYHCQHRIKRKSDEISLCKEGSVWKQRATGFCYCCSLYLFLACSVGKWIFLWGAGWGGGVELINPAHNTVSVFGLVKSTSELYVAQMASCKTDEILCNFSFFLWSGLQRGNLLIFDQIFWSNCVECVEISLENFLSGYWGFQG